MIQLNLPTFDFKIRTRGQSKEIFDLIRKKFVKLTPEEWVRQHFVMYMIHELKYPANFISVETGLVVNSLPKRADLVVYNRTGSPWMIVECKSASVKLNEDVFYQAAGYHRSLNAKYLVITNGVSHFCSKFTDDSFVMEKSFPDYKLN